MADKLKLLFLVISADGGIYRQLVQCWRRWATQNREYSRVLFVRGDPGIGHTYLSDDMTVTAPQEESLIPGVLYKSIDAMKYVLENYSFDYLVRTNLSSFWLNESSLQRYFSRYLPGTGCYAGYVGFHDGQFFVSGAGMIMSPDVVGQVLKNQHLLKRHLPDDVAIGQLIQQQRLASITPLQESRYDIVHYLLQPHDRDISAHLDRIYRNSQITHVRLKNPDRSVDVRIFCMMLDLQSKILADNNYLYPESGIPGEI